jgi:hypothetical protein
MMFCIDSLTNPAMMKPRFHLHEPSNDQIRKISDIFSDLGIVSIASLVLPATFNQPQFSAILGGIALAVTFWTISYWLLSLKN